MLNGWVKIDRKLKNSPIFKNAELLKVWIWCLLSVAYKDTKHMRNTNIIDVKKGAFVTTLDRASKELDMKRDKVRRLLIILEESNCIQRKVQHKETVITVENWELYQELSTDRATIMRQYCDDNATIMRQYCDTKEESKRIYNNINKDKKDDDAHAREATIWNLLSDEEIDKLEREYKDYFELIELADESLRDSGEIHNIKYPLNYVRALAKDKGFMRKNRILSLLSIGS